MIPYLILVCWGGGGGHGDGCHCQWWWWCGCAGFCMGLQNERSFCHWHVSKYVMCAAWIMHSGVKLVTCDPKASKAKITQNNPKLFLLF